MVSGFEIIPDRIRVSYESESDKTSNFILLFCSNTNIYCKKFFTGLMPKTMEQAWECRR